MLYNYFVSFEALSVIRLGTCLLFSMFVSMYIGKYLVKFLHRVGHSQPIRSDGPETHVSKVGTPTMGGVMIICSCLVSSILFCDLSNKYVHLCIFTMLVFSALGFVDDYKKVVKVNADGLPARYKLVVQMVMAIIIYLYLPGDDNLNMVYIPVVKSSINLGILYLPFLLFVITGSSNAVNLTDGLDGLAAGLCIIAFSVLAIIGVYASDESLADMLQIPAIIGGNEIVIFTVIIIGSICGFLWYNAPRAEIFMGDIGSLTLGGLLGLTAVLIKQELLLVVIGGIFVVETISVILQVLYFKKTGGRRLFLMAPLHHHFEKMGMSENKIVVRFYLCGLILGVVSMLIINL